MKIYRAYLRSANGVTSHDLQRIPRTASVIRVRADSDVTIDIALGLTAEFDSHFYLQLKGTSDLTIRKHLKTLEC